jgi:RNA polymerase sigma-70 factor (ECF subfamily)
VFAQTTTHVSLLARLHDGRDTLAWRTFCDRYEELIRGFARRQGVFGSDADDVVQDVMLSLTKAMPGFSYDPAKGKFRSYLKTVVVRAISARSRQNPSLVSLHEGSTHPSPASPSDPVSEPWEVEWRQYHLRQAMKAVRAEFNASDIAAFEAYVNEGRDAAVVAHELGIKVDSVYQAKSRVLRRLSQAIAEQVNEEG